MVYCPYVRRHYWGFVLNCTRTAGTVYSATYALFLLLESFPEPVVPYKFYTPAMRICVNFEQCKQVCMGAL